MSEPLGEWGEDPATDEVVEEPPPSEPQPEPPPTTYYGSVDEFVREFLRFAYRRRLLGRGQSPYWDPQWWQHDEAVMRLEALWRAWEFLRLDPATGMSVWWRDHADHHMRVLMSDEGPFTGNNTTAETGEPLPYEEPPVGMFPDERLN